MTFTPGTYDNWQATFYLSFLSNVGSATILTETLSRSQTLAQAQAAAQATLTANLSAAVTAALANPTVQTVIGNDWTVVWGPEAYVDGPITDTVTATSAKFTTSNAMFVAYSAGSSVGAGSQGRYVVAIAGTNPYSVYDWFTEDFTLTPGTTWQTALQTWADNSKTVDTTTNPVITSGTYTGVTNLLAMTSPTTSGSVTLVEYLRSLTPGTSTVTVTGHSLGGALSPTLALALIDKNNPLVSNWPAAQVYTYPTAGATPGNQDFSNYFYTNFTASVATSPWQVWNAVVWNKLDVVPNAWTCQASLAAPNLLLIPGYYLESGEYGAITCAEIAATILVSANHAKQFATTYGVFGHLDQPNATVPVTGSLNAGVTAADGFSWGPNQTAIAWIDQVLYQHVTAYEQLILQIQPGQPSTLPLPVL